MSNNENLPIVGGQLYDEDESWKDAILRGILEGARRAAEKEAERAAADKKSATSTPAGGSGRAGGSSEPSSD